MTEPDDQDHSKLVKWIAGVRSSNPNTEWVFVCSPQDLLEVEPIVQRLYVKAFPWSYMRKGDARLVTRDWLDKAKLLEWRPS